MFLCLYHNLEKITYYLHHLLLVYCSIHCYRRKSCLVREIEKRTVYFLRCSLTAQLYKYRVVILFARNVYLPCVTFVPYVSIRYNSRLIM